MLPRCSAPHLVRWALVLVLAVMALPSLSTVRAGTVSVTVTLPNSTYPSLGELLQLSITYDDTVDPNGEFGYPLGNVITAMTGTRTVWQATEADPTTYALNSTANVLGVVPMIDPTYYYYNATLNTVLPYTGPTPSESSQYGSLVTYAFYNGTNFTVDGVALFQTYFILYSNYYYPSGVPDHMDVGGWMLWLDTYQPGNLNVSHNPGYEQYQYVINLFAADASVSTSGDITDVQPYPPNYEDLFPLGIGGSDGVIVTSSGAVLGDPQFVGLLGQSYQVHGIDGAVYNLISDKQVQVNARFTFLDHGECLRGTDGSPLFTCWSHPGSYLSELAVRTAAGDSVVVVAGAAEHGFVSVTVNGVTMSVGEMTSLHRAVPNLDALSISYSGVRSVTIANAGLYTLVVENSDGFVNLLRLEVTSVRELRETVQSHGLLGQTWRSDQKGEDVRAVDGAVDDYAEETGNLLGCGFVYNQFECYWRAKGLS